jgi:predicted glycosyltransferase
VLVHGDERLITLPETLPGAETIKDKVRYTGLVAPESVNMSVPPSISADVVISAGGGAVGHALTAAAIGANEYSGRFPDNWLLVVGPERADSDFEKLKAATGQGMRIVRFVPDLARVLAASKVSVSRAGYNTVGDLMRAGCRSVLAPFSGGRETEQLRRARLLAERGLCQLITDDELTPQTLGEAVDRAAGQPPMNAGFDLDGAANSARIIRQFVDSR